MEINSESVLSLQLERRPDRSFGAPFTVFPPECEIEARAVAAAPLKDGRGSRWRNVKAYREARECRSTYWFDHDRGSIAPFVTPVGNARMSILGWRRNFLIESITRLESHREKTASIIFLRSFVIKILPVENCAHKFSQTRFDIELIALNGEDRVNYY